MIQYFILSIVVPPPPREGDGLVGNLNDVSVLLWIDMK